MRRQALPFEERIVWRTTSGGALQKALFIADRLAAYVWPGGYPMYYLDGHHEVLCPACANREFWASIADALRCGDEYRDYGDAPIAHGVHWEGCTLLCSSCYKPIESAYGDPDADEQGRFGVGA